MGLIANLNRWLGGEAADVVAGLRDRLARDGGLALPPDRRRVWDRLVDLLQRLPRPLVALGSLALAGTALLAPGWFAARMDALAALPEGLWWLAGALLSLIFGARYQASEQSFARDLVADARPLAEAGTGTDAALTLQVEAPGDNAALAAWAAQNRAAVPAQPPAVAAP